MLRRGVSPGPQCRSAAPYLPVPRQRVLQHRGRPLHALADAAVPLLRLFAALPQRGRLLGAELLQLRSHALQLRHQRAVLGDGLAQALQGGHGCMACVAVLQQPRGAPAPLHGPMR